MNLGGGEEESNKEGGQGEELNEYGAEWFAEIDDSWYPGMYLITNSKKE